MSSNGSTSALDALDQGGRGQSQAGQSAANFAASLVTAIVLFVVQVLIFLFIHDKLHRIYLPRTFLAPEKERTDPPPHGPWRWVMPVLKTPDSEYIRKCGLDAYFFIRFLRMLLKIFLPLGLLLMPILIPLNYVDGRGTRFSSADSSGPPLVELPTCGNSSSNNVTGLDQIGWQNVPDDRTSRFWAHLVLAVVTVAYVCYTFFDELKSYVRIRQAYLTSPGHRLRASATTVLVRSIPAKWMTVEALDGLFDVFPGGVRNIWLNRNFEKVFEKIQLRDNLATKLEAAETELIRKAKRKQIKNAQQQAKRDGPTKRKQDESSLETTVEEAEGGISGGDPHQVPHNLDEALHEAERTSMAESHTPRKKHLQVPVLGAGIDMLDRGVGALGQDFSKFGRNVLGRPRRGQTEEAHHTVMTSEGPAENILASHSENFGSPTLQVQRRRPASLNDQTDGLQTDFELGVAPLPAPAQDAVSVRKASRDFSHGHIFGKHGLALDRYADPNVDLLAEETKSKVKFWIHGKRPDYPSPQPHILEGDEFPLSVTSPVTPTSNPPAVVNEPGSLTPNDNPERMLKKEKQAEPKRDLPPFLDEEKLMKSETEAVWRQYLTDKDRENMRLPPFGWWWMQLPVFMGIGKKVDVIYWCRKEVARLNQEIEWDQQHPESFPLMNSAFIQFNNQIAAHMACANLTHHKENHMTPRLIEIDPKDVIWDNMAMKWWERYVRRACIIIAVAAMIVAWAIPVTFAGALSQIDKAASDYNFLSFLTGWPTVAKSVLQGVLPVAILGILLAILPLILRFFASLQGAVNGSDVEMVVSNYYFAFLFIQLFLVVSISSGLVSTINEIVNAPDQTPEFLAKNLPSASNYFFSYMILQALSVSAGALIQVPALIFWFIFGKLFDNTAREKFRRQIDLPNVQWGTFFPVYTNLACIGLIYSVIAPLILLFNIITWSLFWFVYRYNSLYVNRFTYDTGGLLYPRAINQLFTGLYVMELCLIGLFFLVRDQQCQVAAYPQAIIMIIVLIATAGFQWWLHHLFDPLIQYLPITLEDEAVRREEEFRRAQESRWKKEDDEYRPMNGNKEQGIEMSDIDEQRKSRLTQSPGSVVRSRTRSASRQASRDRRSGSKPPPSPATITKQTKSGDIEKQALHQNVVETLLTGIPDELEDLTPEERDRMVKRAYQHAALRSRRPAIWIPRDDLGVSDDEIRRTLAATKYIWISNEFAGLDRDAKVVFFRPPPDFSEIDLIQL